MSDMLLLLSPAKTFADVAKKQAVTDVTEITGTACTSPAFMQGAIELIEVLKAKSVVEIQQLMKLSDKLGQLNFQRYHSWKPQIDEISQAAGLYFQGDVYQGLQANDFNAEEMAFAQKHLRILSGLYGILKPLDGIYPYRLEMGTRLGNPKGNNLYDYWSDEVTQALNDEFTDTSSQVNQASQVIVNLASNEYFKVVNPNKLNSRIINIVFQDEKNGKYKIISFLAKKARGLMARFIIQQAITTPEKLTQFNSKGYRFNSALSSENQLVFQRAECDRVA